MLAIVRTTWVAVLLKRLPGPLLRLLDGWSYRLAQRRARERQERWVRRQAAAGKP
jgi:hypothetical protein